MHGTDASLPSSEVRRDWGPPDRAAKQMTASNRMPDGGKKPTDESELNGFEKSLDSHREVHYAKQHDDGRLTQVNIEGRFGEWSVTALETIGRDELGHRLIGTPEDETKEAGKRIAEEWMAENPHGLFPGCAEADSSSIEHATFQRPDVETEGPRDGALQAEVESCGSINASATIEDFHPQDATLQFTGQALDDEPGHVEGKVDLGTLTAYLTFSPVRARRAAAELWVAADYAEREVDT